MTPAARLLALPVRAYRLLASPWVGHGCRFQPTCSAYALEALETHGALRGGWLALRRVLRCHPWGGSGIDNVPRPGRPCGEQQIADGPEQPPASPPRSRRARYPRPARAAPPAASSRPTAVSASASARRTAATAHPPWRGKREAVSPLQEVGGEALRSYRAVPGGSRGAGEGPPRATRAPLGGRGTRAPVLGLRDRARERGRTALKAPVPRVGLERREQLRAAAWSGRFAVVQLGQAPPG